MKLKIFSICMLASFILSSCEGWLDVKPEGSPNDANFWKTDDDFSKAVIGIYGNMGLEETWGRDLFWEQGASDDIFYKRTRSNAQMNLANLVPNGSEESSIKTIYYMLYSSMAICNNIIYQGLKLDAPTEIIKNRIGEAYFMRAFTHFMIAYRYGRSDNGVPFDRYEDYDPYVTKIPEQRASVMDNYRLIVEDCQNASELLPWFSAYGTADYGRATRQAALALMVKTYAYWAQHDPSQWENIPAIVDRLETEGGRGLEENFADVFKIANEWGKEYIWSVNSTGPTQAGSVFPGICLENKGWGIYNGWGNFAPTLELWAEYDENDLRRPVTLMQYGDEFVFFGSKRKYYSDSDQECGFAIAKYMEPFTYGTIDPVTGAGVSNRISTNPDRPCTDLNVPIIRFAEMVLFKAEAYIEMGRGAEAAKELNRLTRRAGLGDVYTDATMKDLMHERRCELAAEFTDRVMDLKRWSVKYPDAKERLEAAKHGIKHVDRSNPNSPVDIENGKTMVINGKTYEGVIEIHAAKQYNADKYCVLPYDPEEIVRGMGAIKQNPGY